MTISHCGAIDYRGQNHHVILYIKNKMPIGKFKFRGNHKRINGGHNQTKIKNFYGTQREHNHDKPFELDVDEPLLLLGNELVQTLWNTP